MLNKRDCNDFLIHLSIGSRIIAEKKYAESERGGEKLAEQQQSNGISRKYCTKLNLYWLSKFLESKSNSFILLHYSIIVHPHFPSNGVVVCFV